VIMHAQEEGLTDNDRILRKLVDSSLVRLGVPGITLGVRSEPITRFISINNHMDHSDVENTYEVSIL
jgi:hypothetical protein